MVGRRKRRKRRRTKRKIPLERRRGEGLLPPSLPPSRGDAVVPRRPPLMVVRSERGGRNYPPSSFHLFRKRGTVGCAQRGEGGGGGRLMSPPLSTVRQIGGGGGEGEPSFSRKGVSSSSVLRPSSVCVSQSKRGRRSGVRAFCGISPSLLRRPKRKRTTTTVFEQLFYYFPLTMVVWKGSLLSLWWRFEERKGDESSVL